MSPPLNGSQCSQIRSCGRAERYTYCWRHANLQRGIRRAKHSHNLRTAEHFNNNNYHSMCMWQQGIQVIRGHHRPSTPPLQPATPPSQMSFYARFDRDNQEAAIEAVLPADHQPHNMSCPDRTNAGPDSITVCWSIFNFTPGYTVNAVDTLANIFTYIYCLSALLFMYLSLSLYCMSG